MRRFVDEMMMENTESLELKMDALTETIRRLRDDLGSGPAQGDENRL